MPKSKKGAVRKGQGTMCNIYGFNCGKDGALKKHIESIHQIKFSVYKDCFYNHAKTIIADSWDDSVRTSSRKKVITHALVRRFVGDPGRRGVTRAANIAK